MTVRAKLLAGSPGDTFAKKAQDAGWRALRTFLQGTVGALPAAGLGATIVDASYWEAFGASVLVALTGALVSFVQNVVSAIPYPAPD